MLSTAISPGVETCGQRGRPAHARRQQLAFSGSSRQCTQNPFCNEGRTPPVHACTRDHTDAHTRQRRMRSTLHQGGGRAELYCPSISPGNRDFRGDAGHWSANLPAAAPACTRHPPTHSQKRAANRKNALASWLQMAAGSTTCTIAIALRGWRGAAASGLTRVLASCARWGRCDAHSPKLQRGLHS